MLNIKVITSNENQIVSPQGDEVEDYVLQAIDANGTPCYFSASFVSTARYLVLKVCERMFPSALGYHSHEVLTIEETLKRDPGLRAS